MEEAAQGWSGAEELHVQPVVSWMSHLCPAVSLTIRLPEVPAAPMGVEGLIERKIQFFRCGVRLQQQREV